MNERQKPAEFDAYSETYADAVNRSIAFSGLGVDFFTRVKADHLINVVDALRPPAKQAEVLDLGCGVGSYHSLLLGRVGRIEGDDLRRAGETTADGAASECDQQ